MTERVSLLLSAAKAHVEKLHNISLTEDSEGKDDEEYLIEVSTATSGLDSLVSLYCVMPYAT